MRAQFALRLHTTPRAYPRTNRQPRALQRAATRAVGRHGCGLVPDR
jgi:hypothetical protein